VGRGIVRVLLPDGEEAHAALPAMQAAAHAFVAERMPASRWRALAPTAVNDALARGVRSAFDPHRLLNPGILGEDPA